MTSPDIDNIHFKLALDYVNYSQRILFLTGKAGTGKTTFLKYLRENTFKRMAVVAPTGVAAINAGGVTMHSLFQIAPGLFLPEPFHTWGKSDHSIQTPESIIRNMKFSPAKRQLLEELELLVVDEVSMVRADMLDAMDTVLRHVRRKSSLPFGGVQLLLIGDLFQLPPVSRPEEWELMRPYYQSTFFFDARVLKESPPVYLELQKIYRQKDQRFINLLNAVRNNITDEVLINDLNEYYDPEFVPRKDEFYITLTTHNNRADLINHKKLAELSGDLQQFDAEITGDFPEKNFPAEAKLCLKANAQIMFIKNDKGENRRFFNGKIAAVNRIDEDGTIYVQFDDIPEEMALEKETWRNIRYRYNKEKEKIEEEELGSFIQYPIRLAWAITIHKSQGLTFEKAIIDAGNSFSAGQVYVALSRMTGLEGLVLKSRILPHAIRTDDQVIAFCRNQPDVSLLAEEMENERIRFVENTLIDAFDFDKLIRMLRPQGYGMFIEYATEDPDVDGWFVEMQESVASQQDIALKFKYQLTGLLTQDKESGYSMLQERTTSAAGYFNKHLKEWKSSVEFEIKDFKNRIMSKKQQERLRDIDAWIERKQTGLEHCIMLAHALAAGKPKQSLLALAENAHRPIPVDGLKEEKSTANDPSKKKRNKADPTEKKEGSANITLRMFREGVDIHGIIASRELTHSTIMGHLLSFIPSGKMKPEELLPADKMLRITEVLMNPEINGLKAAKDVLGIPFTYDEIRAVYLSLRIERLTAADDRPLL